MGAAAAGAAAPVAQADESRAVSGTQTMCPPGTGMPPSKTGAAGLLRLCKRTGAAVDRRGQDINASCCCRAFLATAVALAVALAVEFAFAGGFFAFSMASLYCCRK